MLKSYMQNLYMKAHHLNEVNTLTLMDRRPNAKMLDLGCSDGKWSRQIAARLQTEDIHGVEVLEDCVIAARKAGLEVRAENLEARWTYPDNFFDVVHSSFVIEHMASIDNFVSEIYRVLKPGGFVVTSTENGSSWHNIIAAVMGWQTFSSSCCSTKTKGLGNPFALHRGGGESPPSMTHKVIFNYLGFKEIFEVHGFENLEMRGSGYYPLPACIGNIDQRHAHFLALKAFKPVGAARAN